MLTYHLKGLNLKYVTFKRNCHFEVFIFTQVCFRKKIFTVLRSAFCRLYSCLVKRKKNVSIDYGKVESTDNLLFIFRVQFF